MVAASPVTPESETSKQHIAALKDFLRQYKRPDADPRRDILDGRYGINLAAPLAEFNTPSARAFAASGGSDPDKSCYALVCDVGSVQRHRAIQLLKTNRHPNILSPLASGVVHLSQPDEERFVIVYERPQGRKLSELLASHTGEINELFICKKIIAPLASALEHLSTIDVAHGSINPDTIYMHTTPVLTDCVSAPCGFNQSFCFETLERLQTLPAAKGEGGNACDYYALGVLVLYILHGPEHFASFTPDSLISALMREGPYNALMRGKENPEIFYDLFRGLLTQTATDRWNHRYLKPWVDGKRYNVLLPAIPIASARPFEFLGQEYDTRRAVAHALYRGWDQIHTVLENGSLTQWVANLRNKELSEGISRLAKSAGEIHGKNDTQYAEYIMRILLLLDPAGPIRIGPLAMHVDGIDTLCASLFATKSDKGLQMLTRFIEMNMLSYWLASQRKTPEDTLPNTVNLVMAKLERLRANIRNTTLGFGPERILYELNPDMPCQSPLLKGAYVRTIPVMLAALDRLAPSISDSQDPIDRHMAAFIAGKLSVQHEIRLRELVDLPIMGTNKAVLALKLLTMADHRAGAAFFPGITHMLAIRILPVIDKMRSRTLKARLQTLLIDYAQSGALQAMGALIISSDYATAEHDGFTRAWSIFHGNAAHIESLRMGEHIETRSNHLGLMLSKFAAYGIFFITLLHYMMDR